VYFVFFSKRQDGSAPNFFRI